MPKSDNNPIPSNTNLIRQNKTPKPLEIPLPKQLWHDDSIDLTRHRYQGKLLTQVESVELGKNRRKQVALGALATLGQRPSAINALSIYHWSNQGRLQELLPIRAKRMSVSPFTYFRGMPSMMLFDQAWQPSHSGLFQQICGDCHLNNFGGYASPERNLLFGINDFDETMLAPFEWDIQRLVSSIMVAVSTLKLGESIGLKAIEKLLNSYQMGLERHRSLSPVQVWYEKVEMTELLANAKDIDTHKAQQQIIDKARRNDATHVLPKLTDSDKNTGLRQFKVDSPLQQAPTPSQPFATGVAEFFEDYRDSLKFDRQVLFDRYQLSDVALKVVGVGSVGTAAAIALFEDADHEPLILQMKQAKSSILSPLLVQPVPHEGERVVHGQQLMQASSDIFLGYAKLQSNADSSHATLPFYVRQLRDMKYSADLTKMDDDRFYVYVESCGLALAHAHAKAGNADVLIGYLDKGNEFMQAMQTYAVKYAARNLADYEQFMNEIASGNIAIAGDEVL